MSAHISTDTMPGGKPRVVVELTCDLCGAQVIHTDTVPPDVVSNYLSKAGWVIVDHDADTQTTLCPQCAPLAGKS